MQKKKGKGGRGGCLWLFVAVLLIFSTFAVPAHAVLQNMWADVYKWEGGVNSDGKMVLTKLSSGVTYKVLATASNTAETLYVYNSTALTSLTNPITTTAFALVSASNKHIAFQVDPTDSSTDRYVDLIVVDTGGGYTAFIEKFDKYQHAVVIDERPNVMHHGMIWFGGVTTGLVDTGIDFKLKTMIQDVRVEVVTVESGISIDVGLGLAADTSQSTAGFRSNVLCTAAGFVADTGVITSGASIDYVPASTYGTMLYTSVVGGGATFSDNGGKTWLGYAYTSATTGASLTYIIDGTTAAGYIHYWFTRMRGGL